MTMTMTRGDYTYCAVTEKLRETRETEHAVILPLVQRSQYSLKFYFNYHPFRLIVVYDSTPYFRDKLSNSNSYGFCS